MRANYLKNVSKQILPKFLLSCLFIFTIALTPAQAVVIDFDCTDIESEAVQKKAGDIFEKYGGSHPDVRDCYKKRMIKLVSALYGEYANQGMQFYYKGNYKDSYLYWQEAKKISATETDGLAAYYLGSIAYRQKKLKEAERHLKLAVNDKKYFGKYYKFFVPSAYAVLGFTYNRLQKGSQAINALEKSLALGYDKDPLVYEILSYFYHQKKQLRKSVNALESAIRLRPKDADNYANLASVYKEMGQLKKALNNFNRFMIYNKRAKSDPVYKTVKKELSALKSQLKN